MILVCDVGGTRTRLALAAQVEGAWALSGLEESPTSPDVNGKVARFAAGRDVTAAAFGGAGPNEADGSIRLTNAGVILDPVALAQAAGVSRTVVINDFRAIAEAIPYLPKTSLQDCGGGAAVSGQPLAVMGPGTGPGA